MGFVDMGCNNESMVSLRPAHCRLVAHLICFFRGYFSGLKGLAYLIGDDIILLLSAGDVLILPFGKNKFFISSLGITLIGADKFAVIGFCSILRVVGAVSQTLSDRLAFVYMERNQSCCSHSHHILSKRKSHRSVTFHKTISASFPDLPHHADMPVLPDAAEPHTSC